MGDIPKLDVSGFPFRNGDDAAIVRVLVSTLDPLPDSVDALLEVLDGALIFAARYSAAAQEVAEYDNFVRAFSPLEVERFRMMHEERTAAMAWRPDRRAPRPNIFAPTDGVGGQEESSSSVPSASAGATPLLTGLATARVRAAAELRILRDGVDQQLQIAWLRAVRDAAALLVLAGKAKVTY